MADNDTIRKALEEAQLNRIGAVTDAQTALKHGRWATAAHYVTEAGHWDGRVKALTEVLAEES